jgi:hypothetical protein
LDCGIIHEPNIATGALWVHGGVAVVLLERTYGAVWPVADSAGNDARRRRPRLGRWNGGKDYLVNLLLVLRSHPSAWGTLRNAE